ncbi:MAG: rod-binding protein [Pseudomonadota bacterium]
MPPIVPPGMVPVIAAGGSQPLGRTPQEKLRSTCQDFEAVFVYKLLEQMRATTLQSGYLHGEEEDVYNAICDQQVAMALSRSGGIGLADMLCGQLAGEAGAGTPSVPRRSGSQDGSSENR